MSSSEHLRATVAPGSLAHRIRIDVTDLDRVVQRASSSWHGAQGASPDALVYVESVALNLHGFYSGVERLLELIARHIDRAVPGGDAWHQELLSQMTREVPGVRPAVLSADRAVSLNDLRRFRHIVRHLYTVHLDPERMRPLLSALPALWDEVRADLLAFAEFLEDLAERQSSSDR
ncbi:MAG: hypothetical protein AVDCRST_MAG77-4330 [uncultured Chloroflexi bacterium]|uniref:HepT-like domain-containing protein n=1 Tax=uncultured Chloroflexota bacterium TaxID=166587 RepID=A0A6J4JHD1_9CHLR|nr:MAG: hypothetical protein AVDCRST_MAG77-4330 [uncultured Chloroflexota bacterium]